MTKFQVGDKVRLTEAEVADLKRDDSWAKQAGFTASGIYTVTACDGYGMVAIEGVTHPISRGVTPWDPARFVKVEEEQMTLQVGDRVRLTQQYGEIEPGELGTIRALVGQPTFYPYRVAFDNTEHSQAYGILVRADEIEPATEEPESKYKFAVGDRVGFNDGYYSGSGTVLRIDEDDPSLTYFVDVDDNDSDWFGSDDLLALEPEQAAQRPDYTFLIDEADNIIGIFDGSPLADTVRRLRNALVDETYREIN